MNSKIYSQMLVGTCLLCIFFTSSASPATKVPSFTVVDRYIVGGEGGWDLLSVDVKRHHLFLSRSSHVQVVDTESRKIAGDIPGTEGVHAIALADDLNMGFTSNGKSNSVTVFDLTTLQVIDTIKISGKNPDVILYDSASKHLFTFNGRSNNVTVIDAISKKEIATITLSGKPELAVSDDAGKIFVNIEDKSEIAVLDISTNTVVKTYSLGAGEEPTGLAIDRQHHRLFSVCANQKMIVLDADSGKIVSELVIGSGPDSAAFDAKLGVALSSNGDGTLTIVKEEDPEHFSVLQNVVTAKGARTMAYDDTAHRAYLVSASFGKMPLVTESNPKPRPVIIPDSFEIIVVSVTH